MNRLLRCHVNFGEEQAFIAAQIMMHKLAEACLTSLRSGFGLSGSLPRNMKGRNLAKSLLINKIVQIVLKFQLTSAVLPVQQFLSRISRVLFKIYFA